MPDGSETTTVQGTFLAFDFGTKRIGVAVGNSISGTAQPLTTLHGEQNEQRFAAIETLIREWQPRRWWWTAVQRRRHAARDDTVVPPLRQSPQGALRFTCHSVMSAILPPPPVRN